MKKELQLKKSLALLGHGKWKSALGHTLLIIGMALVSLGAFAQQQEMTPIPEGLVMEKKWQSNDPTGRTGNILVEAFVTGHSVAQHVPTDIVLVLDVSGSMDEHLYDPVETPTNGWTYNNYGSNHYYYRYVDNNDQVTFCLVERYSRGNRYYLRFTRNNGYYDQTYYLTGSGHTTQQTGSSSNSQDGVIYTGVLYEQQETTKMEALQTSVGLFVDIIANDATTYNVEHRISIVKYAGNRFYGADTETEDPATATGASSLTEGNNMYNGGDYWDPVYYNYTEVLIHRRDPRTDATYIKNQVDAMQPGGATSADFGMYKARYVLASIPAEEFEERNKVVVMFTDGSPTHINGFVQSVANSTINYAHDLKNSCTVNGTNYDFNATVFSVGVFDVETDNIKTYMERVSSNYPEATSMTNTCTQASTDYYFKAESAGGLSEIFEAIAGASGAMSLPASAIVQDMVSPNFQLPAGASGTVTAYAPKCTGYDETTGEYSWENLNDNGTLTIGTITVDGEQVSGVVTGGGENKLPTNFVTVNGKTIQMSGFNFSHHWCGYVEDPETHQNVIHGRKIVIKIPVVVNEGTWGDGIQTNDPEHSYIRVPDPNNQGQYIYYGPFNNLTTNVLGDVWTEIVTSKPTGYDNMNIDTPEELAWFISEVNGRIHYNGNTNNVASNPSLSGRLTADIDMSAHNWVPIGAGYKCNANNEWLDANGNVTTDLTKRVKLAYEGTFDGNGHVITGLKNNADKWYKTASGQENEVVVYPGMFSNVKGTVHDVFILDSDFRGKAHQVNGKGKFIHHGILADTLTGGTIYNCEAAGRMTCNNDNANDANLIYGGLVGLNNGGTIYNAMAMAELTGYAMGGAVGENRSGSFSNGFTNGVYKYLGETGANAKAVGGIAGTNSGTINNCYVRFERFTNENLNKATFGMLVGSGTAATNSYIPQIVTWSRPNTSSSTTQVNLNNTVPNTVTTPAGNPTDSYTLSVSPSFFNMFTNDNMTGGTWGTTTISGSTFNVYKNGTPLEVKLNKNKGTNGATWKRTTAGGYSADAGNINGDFPVLQLPGYNCLASTNGITIDYARNLSDMLHRHNSGALNENTTLPNQGSGYVPSDPEHPSTHDYHVSQTVNKAQSDFLYGGSINLFVNDDNRSSAKAQKEQNTNTNVVVYIDENISLLQDEEGSIEAYTGQTLQAFDNTDIQEGERWHNISSSLSNSQFGWHYDNNGKVPHNTNPDPCGWNLNKYDEDYAFYPIDLGSYRRADFYCFYEPQYHWINFRRNGQSHWHMDLIDDAVGYDDPTNHAWIDYVNEEGAHDNEDHFIPGKGYLTAIDMSFWWEYDLDGTTISKQAQFMQNRGTLNNGDITIPVSYTADNEWTGLAGYNLLGNPYQSYLDFEKFITENTGEGKIWSGDEAFAQTYAVYDPEAATYLQYKESTSKEAKAADQNINMHQGFMIRVSKAGTAKFTNDMRTNTKGNGFRGTENHYPLINFMLNNGTTNDVAVLELGRPENDGALKLRVGDTKGRISLRHDNQDFGILFRDMTEGSQPLYFDTDEDGTFTLSWNTANADFSLLTLVDNLTGVRYDMLANDSYSFEGKASDYRSRFKVVIGRFTDVEENEEVVTDNFAFFDGSDWVVNGQGQLTVTDMTGRTVYTSNLTNDQNRVSLNGVAQGIYLMRVANGQNVNVQKIVVR